MKKEKSQQVLQKYKKREKHEQLYTNKFDNLEEICQLSRDIQPAKTESRRNKSTEETDHQK